MQSNRSEISDHVLVIWPVGQFAEWWAEEWSAFGTGPGLNLNSSQLFGPGSNHGRHISMREWNRLKIKSATINFPGYIIWWPAGAGPPLALCQRLAGDTPDRYNSCSRLQDASGSCSVFCSLFLRVSSSRRLGTIELKDGHLVTAFARWRPLCHHKPPNRCTCII